MTLIKLNYLIPSRSPPNLPCGDLFVILVAEAFWISWWLVILFWYSQLIWDQCIPHSFILHYIEINQNAPWFLKFLFIHSKISHRSQKTVLEIYAIHHSSESLEVHWFQAFPVPELPVSATMHLPIVVFLWISKTSFQARPLPDLPLNTTFCAAQFEEECFHSSIFICFQFFSTHVIILCLCLLS